MNNMSIIGNLTRDPEIREFPDKNHEGQSLKVCTFTVAVNDGFGEHKKTEFVRVTAWRGLGENCAKYLTKGKKVYASGVVGVSAWLSNTGEAHASLELRAEKIEFLSPAERQANDPAAQPAPETAAPAEAPTEVDTDNLPF